MTEEERTHVRELLAQAISDGLRVRGETQASWQVFHLINQLDPGEWHAVLSYAIYQLEDEGVHLVLAVAEPD